MSKSNFKFIKRVSVVLILFIGVLWSTGVAFAGFVSTSVQDDEKNFNAAAAAVEAVPSKTDGEIVNCFDYYRFPSIQASFDAVKKSYEPGQTVYFKGELVNENNYPIADGYLFVRIARYNENYTQEGHDIVDEFFAKSGPQGNEKFYLENKEKKGTVLSWSVPENLAEGDYVASFSFVVGKKMNLAGLSFTNEIDAGSAGFEVKKSALGAKKVFLEKSSFAVNGKKYDHIGLWPMFDKGAKMEVSGKLKNETLKKEKVKLVYDLYYWDGLDAQNKISSQSEDITVAPNSSRSFKYVIPKMDETVYFLRITTVADNNQKSIVNLRFVSEQERPRINFFSPLKFPVLKGETMTNFICFHNTADNSAQGKVIMTVFDESGDKIQTLGYEGEITGDIMAVKKDMVASKNYGYLKMAASVIGADGRETDSYEMIYDCKNMNPGNKECARIQEEKTAVGASVKQFDKKDVAVGIIALMAIMAIAALARKFFINKAKPPLMFLLFALAVGSAVFLASGAGNYVLAKDTTVSQSYNFPPNVDCAKPGQIQNSGIRVYPAGVGKFCLSGTISPKHTVDINNTNNVLDVDDVVNFIYNPEEPYYLASGGAYDTPYGKWCEDLSNQNCRDQSYFEVPIKTGGDLGLKGNASLQITWLAVKPAVYMTSSDDSIIACNGMTCTAKKQGKEVTLTANIGAVTARPWVRVVNTKNETIWEGSGVDTEGMSDKNLPSTVIIWSFDVDPGMPTCSASFSSTEISAGESTIFSWKTTGDQNGLIPIICTDSAYNPEAEVHTSGYFSISPDSNQTCTATASNNNGLNVKSCSATVEVSVAPPVSELPDKPQNFTASSACQAVNLSWNKDSNGEYDSITNNGSTVVNYYEITRDGSYTIKKSDNINRSGWSNNSYTDSGATDSTKTYSYTIKACNKKIECSKEAGPSTATPNAGPCKGTGDPTPPTPPSPPPTPPTIPPDPGTANLTLKKNGSGNVQLYGWRGDSWNDYGDTVDSNFQNNETQGLKKNWWFKMSAVPDSGSSFSSWSGCTSTSEGKSWTDIDGVVHYSMPSSGENACYVTMTGDKTVTVTFTSSSGPGGECPGCGSGGSLVKAYISAKNTVVSDGNNTAVTWTSDNATSCEQVDNSELGSGSYKDTGWISADDTTSGNYTTSNFTTSGGPRTYKVTCTNGPQSADAEVPISVGDYPGSPSVSMWADPQSVGYKKTSMIQWLSSNIFPNSCILFSASDTMNGYLSYFNFSSKQYFGPGYYKSEISENNSTGQKTGKLSGDTAYKIQCGGYGPSFSKVTAQTTVIAAKPVSNFTLTNPTGGSLVATIVEGLSANSSSLALALSGEAIGNVNLSASIPAISGAKAQFSSDDGTTWSDTLSVDISAISQVKIRVIKIPGATPVGTYNTAVTATDTGTGGKTKKLNVNLKVNKVSSEWEEF